MKKIRLLESVPKITEIEVSFPVYRYHDCGGDDFDAEYFVKVDANLRQVSISKSHHYTDSHDTWELEIEQLNSLQAGSESLDYTLGRGKYALTEARWLEVLAEFKAEVKTI